MQIMLIRGSCTCLLGGANSTVPPVKDSSSCSISTRKKARKFDLARLESLLQCVQLIRLNLGLDKRLHPVHTVNQGLQDIRERRIDCVSVHALSNRRDWRCRYGCGRSRYNGSRWSDRRNRTIERRLGVGDMLLNKARCRAHGIGHLGYLLKGQLIAASGHRHRCHELIGLSIVET
jgi:hypothetical protein